jgi:hypothetical protein
MTKVKVRNKVEDIETPIADWITESVFGKEQYGRWDRTPTWAAYPFFFGVVGILAPIVLVECTYAYIKIRRKPPK